MIELGTGQSAEPGLVDVTGRVDDVIEPAERVSCGVDRGLVRPSYPN
jgi:hypothetical protein